MKPFSKLGLIAASLGLAGMLAVSGAALAQTRIVLSNDNPALGVKGKTFEVLKADLEKRLAGKVQVDLHHSGTLFNQRTQIQGTQLGSANLIAPGQGIFASLAPKLNVLSVPFLLNTPAAIDAAIKDPKVAATFLPDLESKNLKIVAIWLNGPRDISTRAAKPILTPADMRGLKIRVQPAPVDLKTMQTVGANVVTIDWTEAATAMQQGVIDAVEPTPSALTGAGFVDLIGQTSLVSYRYDFYLVATGKSWWDRLPADVRTGFEESLKVATAWNWENTQRENDAAYAQVKAAGKPINALSPEQRKLWVDALQPVWVEFGDKLVGVDIMARLKEIDATAK